MSIFLRARREESTTLYYDNVLRPDLTSICVTSRVVKDHQKERRLMVAKKRAGELNVNRIESSGPWLARGWVPENTDVSKKESVGMEPPAVGNVEGVGIQNHLHYYSTLVNSPKSRLTTTSLYSPQLDYCCLTSMLNGNGGIHAMKPQLLAELHFNQAFNLPQ